MFFSRAYLLPVPVTGALAPHLQDSRRGATCRDRSTMRSRVEPHDEAEAAARGACAVGAVKREHPRREFGDGHPALGAGKTGGDRAAPRRSRPPRTSPSARSIAVSIDSARRGLIAVFQHDPVDHYLDIVFFVLLELDLLVEVTHSPSARTRTKPFFRAERRTLSSCSPFRPLTTGAITWRLASPRARS